MQSVGWPFSKIKGYEGVRSSVRQVILEVDPIVTLPSVDRLHYDNETYRFLITVPGRGPVCFRCDCVGHTRRECNAPYCHHCEVYTHSTEECTVKRCQGAGNNVGRDDQDAKADDGKEHVDVGMETEGQKEGGGAGTGDVNAETDRVEADGVQTNKGEDDAVGGDLDISSDVEEGVGTVPDTQDSLYGLVKDNEPELFNTASDDNADMSSDAGSVDSVHLKRKKFNKK